MATSLQKMNYEESGKLSFLDFFPKTPDYEVDDVGGIDYGTGYSGKAGYGFTLFARSTKGRGTTAILLDFDDDCPEAEGNALLQSLGLNLQKGMSYEQVMTRLGTPERDNRRFLRFIINKQSPYYVGCSINEKNGLFRVWVARKDLADKNDA